MSDELKPCPFCGGEAKISTDDDIDYAIYCDDCPGGIESYSLTTTELIQAWNKRTEHREG